MNMEVELAPSVASEILMFILAGPIHVTMMRNQGVDEEALSELGCSKTIGADVSFSLRVNSSASVCCFVLCCCRPATG